MKRWICVASRFFALATSFAALSLAPVAIYSALSLWGAWPASDSADPLRVLGWSVVGAGAFSLGVAPFLSRLSQRAMRRFGWSAPMMPALLACAGTLVLSGAGGALGWHLPSWAVLGGGAAVGAVFGSYWWPLRWAQRVLPRFDAKCGQWRDGLNARFDAGRAARRVSLS